ncbi:MAG: hypothetical protein Gyms2KO_33090 [Gymnodinialimonas sp.]
MRETDDLSDRQRRDFDDLQNEIAGREVGRISRFLTQDDERSAEGKRRKRAEEALRRTLDVLLQDPVYRARYEAVRDALGRAERATVTALANLGVLISQAQSELADMRQRAARLPDGTRVYQDQSGAVRREDGTIVDETLAATILWRGDEPSFEDYAGQRDRLEGLVRDHSEVERYQTDILGDARNRLSDEENPPSLEELDAIIGDIGNQMPNSARQLIQTEQPEPEPSATAQVAIPELGAP